MKKILIIGVTEITKIIVPVLCSDAKYATEICIAAPNKSECDFFKQKYAGSVVRITTARLDPANEAGTRMMLSINQPELIVNLMPPETSISIMKHALECGAYYIDTSLFEWNSGAVLSKQFELFGEFRNKDLTAICGCAFNPAVLTSFVRLASKKRFDSLDSADVIEVNMTAASEISDVRDLIRSADFKAETEKAICISDGKRMEVDPLSLKTNRELNDIGMKTLYLLNNPIVEDFLKEIPEVPNVRYFSTYEKKSDAIMDALMKTGMLSDKPIEIQGVKIAPIDFLSKVMPVENTKKIPEGKSLAGVVVSGKWRGQDKTIFICICGDNAESFEKYGVSAAGYFDAQALLGGIKLICTDKWKKPGVFTACAFDPDLLLERMKKDGFYYQLYDTESINTEQGEEKEDE